MKSEPQLAGKTAVVTGAGRGIGRAIALAYAHQGARVVVVARSSDEIAETVWLIEELGQQAHAVQADIRMFAQVENLVAQTLQVYGYPDILVNSAGVGLCAPLAETSEEQWDTVHDTLLKGTYMVTRAFVSGMVEQRRGNIINIGAPVEKLALPGFSAYCAAKYGVEGLTRALAKELRRSGINVNALHPGGFADTRLLRETAPDAASKGALSPDTIAEAAVFLAAQKPRGKTGEVIDAQEWAAALLSQHT